MNGKIMIPTMRYSTLFIAFLVMSSLAACGDDKNKDDPDDPPSNEGTSCACPDGVCASGECVLQIVLDKDCADDWGTAQIFLGDLSANATPVGTITVDAPFTTCEAFQAPTQDANGAMVSGEKFEFIVESEDTRLLSGPGESECAGSMPFVWQIDCD